MLNFVNVLLSNLFGSDISLMTLGEVSSHLAGASSWVVILDPTFLMSFVTYFFSFMAVWQICCVFPFRLLKRLIRFPSVKDK